MADDWSRESDDLTINGVPKGQRQGHPRFYDLLRELADLHERKNSNYSAPNDPLSNLRFCARLKISPVKGVVVRMGDKWCRIEQLVNGTPDLVWESLVDTLRDMAVYALLAIVLIEDESR
jgi:hypothetical protein